MIKNKMRYSVCIIDNDIPAAGTEAQAHGIKDSEILNASNLQLLLQKETWSDDVIKNLVQKLLDQKDDDGISPKWEVFGLTHPSLCVKALDHELFRPDIIVFDWEYPATGAGAGTDSETLLKEILEKTFCIAFVFSKPDKTDEINAVLEKEEFKEYKTRLHYLDKTSGEEDQAAKLIADAEAMSTSNFSFQVAKDFRKKSLQIMDKILSDLGRATLSDIKNYLKLEDGEARRNLIDFVADRFRGGLVSSDVHIPDFTPTPIAPGTVPDYDLIKRIWSHRLYLPIDATIDAGDEFVRRGDIVKWQDKFFLVLSADCDLHRFWHKNFGTINLLPLHHLRSSNSELRDMLTLCVSPADLKRSEFKHLIEKFGSVSDGPFILPFVRIDGTYREFVVMPKEFSGYPVKVHPDVLAFSKKVRKDKQLKYVWWEGAEKIASVCEPFQSAIVHHTFSIIGGYGVPDYPSQIKPIFESILDEFLTTPAATPVADHGNLAPALVEPQA
jgi:hypothetical protein